MGDLSENSEYTEAKRDLGHLESRLRYLGKQLKYAQVIEKSNKDEIDLGSIVELLFEGEDESDTYQVVGRMEADLEKGKVSFDSPLGQAIMKQKADTTVTVEAPAGNYQVKILKVE